MVLVFLPFLPETVPVHVGFGGTVTRYGSPMEWMFVSLFPILMQAVPVVVKWQYKGNDDAIARNLKVLGKMNIAISMIFLGLILWFVFLTLSESGATQPAVDVERIVGVIISLSWIIIGNFLPQVKKNMLLGIRTTWTLKCETTWAKTHRLGGRLFVGMGIASTILCLFVLEGLPAIIFSTAAPAPLVVVLIAYSYDTFKKTELSI